MKIAHASLVALTLVFPILAASAAEVEKDKPSPMDAVKWIEGPAVGRLGDEAAIKIPEGYIFAGADDTRTIMEAMHNTVSGAELGFLARKAEGWFIVFEYDGSGYVSDAEKDKLDADAILASLRASNDEGNKERKKRGWGTLAIEGWETKPAYNPTTNNIEWATRLRSEQGGVSINHNIRILGRHGVMSAVLVAGPEEIAAAAPVARDVLTAGYTFNSGKTYAEFRQGDKIAKYGLVGLITGGAAVVAAKSGLFKGLWKLIVVAVAAAGAFFKKLFGRKSAEPSFRP